MYPVSDWMLVEKVEEEDNGAVVLPDTYEAPVEDNSTSWKVLAKGPGYVHPQSGMFISTDYIEVGDIVVLGGTECAKFDYKGQTYYAAQARHVAFMESKTHQDKKGEDSSARNQPEGN